MSDRHANFSRNLNFLKENKGFTVPFLASKLSIELRTVEKWFYENKVPGPKNMAVLLSFLSHEYGITENDLYASPSRKLGDSPKVSSNQSVEQKTESRDSDDKSALTAESIADAVAAKLEAQKPAPAQDPRLAALLAKYGEEGLDALLRTHVAYVPMILSFAGSQIAPESVPLLAAEIEKGLGAAVEAARPSAPSVQIQKKVQKGS